jgi:soluble lytic murein transglycosylase-like protein
MWPPSWRMHARKLSPLLKTVPPSSGCVPPQLGRPLHAAAFNFGFLLHRTTGTKNVAEARRTQGPICSWFSCGSCYAPALLSESAELIICGAVGGKDSLPLSTIKIVWLLALVTALVIASVSCTPRGYRSDEGAPIVSAILATDLQHLLASTLNPDAAKSLDVREIVHRTQSLKQSSPMWPINVYLLAEVLRLRGDTVEAKKFYADLASWAATDAYHDGSGGSSLASVALWRWLELASDSPNLGGNEATQVMEVSDKLQDTRLVRGMYEPSVLSTLPQLQEDTVRHLALLSWVTGRKDQALRLFLEYLSLARTAELTPAETPLMQQLLASGLASSDHLTLFRGKRLLSLGRYQEASKLLIEARRSQDPDVRNEAGLFLARLERFRGVQPAAIVRLLDSVLREATDPEVGEKALYERALVFNREGSGRNVQASLKDLNQLVETYPQGRLAADSLYEIGRHFQYAGDTDQALKYFENVRAFNDPTRREGMATFSAALTLYTRGRPADLTMASHLLQELSNQAALSELRPGALFWLGRIAAESGDQDRSKRYFEQIIAETPYDYYAVRSRIHLRLGNRASSEVWPDSEIKSELRSAYQNSKLDTSLSRKSSYHLRLAGALGVGLYSTALSAELQLRKDLPSRRLEDISLKELDDTGLFAHLVLLLAFRQDAAIAKDLFPDAKNRLQIAAAVGQIAGDWPMAMALIVAGKDPYERRAAAQCDNGYLATAFPKVYTDSFRRAGVAWSVPPELIYSIAREESLFSPTALSSSGASGLLQFTPKTFLKLDRQWSLLQSSGVSSSEEFLLNPDLSIQLGARWFNSLLGRKGNAAILLAVMDHNAGGAAVSEWVSYWSMVGRARDIEFMIETVRFLETRIFLRRVLADEYIVDAAGILRTDNDTASGKTLFLNEPAN